MNMKMVQPSRPPKPTLRIDVGSNLLASVSIDAGVIYAPVARNTDIRRENNSIRTFGVASGKLLWSVDVQGDPGIPLHIGGTVYATTSTGYVYGIDSVSGAVQWHTRIQKPGNVTQPGLAAGLVFIQGEDAIWALDAKSGKRKWKAGISGCMVVAPEAGLIFAAKGGATLCALDAQTGAVRWEFRSDNARSLLHLALTDGALYAWFDDDLLRRIDLLTGKEQWHSGVPIRAVPAVANGVCYTTIWDDKEDGERLVALDLVTNRLLWRTRIMDYPGWFPFSIGARLLYANPIEVITGSEVLGLERDSGRERWVLRPEAGEGYSFPQISDGRLLVMRNREMLVFEDSRD